MGLFKLFKSKSTSKTEQIEKNQEIADFFNINIHNIMDYNPKLTKTFIRDDGYEVKTYHLQLNEMELDTFLEIEINDVSKENYNIIFHGHNDIITPAIRDFINFCVDKYGNDIEGGGKIYTTGKNNKTFIKTWEQGISIDNIDGHISITIFGVKKKHQENNINNTKENLDTIGNKIKFNNIEIEGNIEDFVTKIEELGFKNKITFPESCALSMEGIFLNKECTIIVMYTEKESLVGKLIVSFNEHDTWNSIEQEYFYIKNLFKKKYYEDNSVEDFLFPYNKYDGNEIEAVKNGKCAYVTLFVLENGVISIKICNNMQVSVHYENTKNFQQRLDEIEAKQLNEI